MESLRIFKVIRILDEYRIVINAGTNDHMPDYCYFQIIGAHDEITDPDTNQSLGFIPSIKEIVRPIMIKEKFCICEDADDWFVQLADISQQNSLLFTNARKLHINKKQIENCGLGEPINIKDKAVLMSMDSETQQHSKKMNSKKNKSDHPLLFMSFLE